jgi:hypothetical protein
MRASYLCRCLSVQAVKPGGVGATSASVKVFADFDHASRSYAMVTYKIPPSRLPPKNPHREAAPLTYEVRGTRLESGENNSGTECRSPCGCATACGSKVRFARSFCQNLDWFSGWCPSAPLGYDVSPYGLPRNLWGDFLLYCPGCKYSPQPFCADPAPVKRAGGTDTGNGISLRLAATR